MTEDRPTEQPYPGKLAKSAVVHERAGSQYGIVAPERGIAHLHGCQSGRKQGRVQPVGELLDTGEQGTAPDDPGVGLQDTNPWFQLHQPDHAHQGISPHQAVGIQHHGVTTTAAPAPQEVGHVTAFVVEVNRAAPVEQPAIGIQFLTQTLPGCLLFKPDFRVTAVGEDIKLKMLQVPGTFEIPVNRAQPP